MIDKNNIQAVLARMVQLLNASERDDWANALEVSRQDFMKGSSAVRSTIISMYGGAGSLNDLVLYKNGKVLEKESDEFGELRSILYDLLHRNIQPTQ